MAAGPTTDLPRIGDVLSYIYLFKHEASTRDEGIKQRPVAVIDVDHPKRRVAVLAITTKGETYPDTIMLPDDVARAAKLQLKSAVLVCEYNVFTWVGFDIRPVADGYVASRLPPGFAHKIRQAAVDVGATAINRD